MLPDIPFDVTQLRPGVIPVALLPSTDVVVSRRVSTRAYAGKKYTDNEEVENEIRECRDAIEQASQRLGRKIPIVQVTSDSPGTSSFTNMQILKVCEWNDTPIN